MNNLILVGRSDVEAILELFSADPNPPKNLTEAAARLRGLHVGALAPGKMNRVVAALLDFINTIEAVDGVKELMDGSFVLLGDEEWPDLASVYADACRVLGREPKILKQRCECGRDTDDCTYDETDPESKHGDAE